MLNINKSNAMFLWRNSMLLMLRHGRGQDDMFASSCSKDKTNLEWVYNILLFRVRKVNKMNI